MSLSGLTALFAATLFSQPSVLTWHNDNFRTGQNLQETILTPGNVKSSTFGRLFTIGVDGKVDAQPLYVPHLTIPGQGVHNVLYVATEHNSVYGFDADNGAQLLHASLSPGTEATSDTHGCNGQISPEIGITATPVIDPTIGPHGTIYVVAMTKDLSNNYHQRIHALDLTTLAEEFGGPTEITATSPGSPEESTFLPGQHEDRAALLLSKGVVYTSWSSHCDARPYVSWIIGYSATTLARTSVLNLEPKGIQGAIWAAGSGPQADAAGNIYVPTGNGTFDTTLLGNGMPSNGNFGNAYVKMSTTSGLAVADYFTMLNTVAETGQDTDLGSGGGMLLPPLNDTGGHARDLAVVAGKDTNIYVMDRSNLGKFHPNSDEIYQQLSGVLAGGMWSSPAWFNGSLYYGPQGNVLKAFFFSNGKFSTNPSSQTSATFSYPGTTPSVSANGTSNGIVWASTNGTAVLHAYSATNLGNELYNSNQASAGRDHFGSGNKFIVPVIVNGKVYVASNGGVSGKPGSVAVFGLLNSSSDFSLSQTPFGTIQPGTSGQSTVTVAASGGFNGTVSFTVSGLPSGATASFSPTTVTGAGSTTMTVSTTSGVTNGTFTVTVTGTSGSSVHTSSTSLTVAAASLTGVHLGVFENGIWTVDMDGNGQMANSERFGWGVSSDLPVTGDWNGSGRTKAGIFRNGVWYLDLMGDHQITSGNQIIGWGQTGDVPVVGDWNHSGTSKLGIFRNGVWYLDLTGSHQITSGNQIIGWGQTGDMPLVGDWNGDGTAKIGVFRNGVWYLDTDGNHQLTSSKVIGWGQPGDIPVVGDWNGDGKTKIGVFRDGIWYLDLTGSHQMTQSGIIGWGQNGDVPVVGDWNSNGTSKIGIYRSGVWYLDLTGNHQLTSGSQIISWGNPGNTPEPGNW